VHVVASVRRVFTRRLFRGAALSTAVFASMAMSECPVSPDAAACDGKRVASYVEGDEFDPLPTPYNAYRDGGQAHFDWGMDISGLCVEAPESGNYSRFVVDMYSGSDFRDFNFEGRVYHAPFIRPYSALLRVASGQTTRFEGTVHDIGLRQGNPNGSPASISVELHVSVNSSGNIVADQARVLEAIRKISIETYYSGVK
jgi:hypothetical protein